MEHGCGEIAQPDDGTPDVPPDLSRQRFGVDGTASTAY